jgi:hypothetical protein
MLDALDGGTAVRSTGHAFVRLSWQCVDRLLTDSVKIRYDPLGNEVWHTSSA